MANEYLNNKNLEKAIVKFQTVKRERVLYDPLIAALTKNPKRRVRSPSNQLINLDECVAEKKRVEEEYVELQNILAQSFSILADNIVTYMKFQHIDNDDAIQECVMLCFLKIDRFNPIYGKGFNYFTSVVINSLRQMYRVGRSYCDFKTKYQNYLQNRVEQSILTGLRKSKAFRNKGLPELPE